MGENGRNMGTEKEKPTMWEWGVILLIYCYNKLIEKTGKQLAISQWTHQGHVNAV